MKNEEQKSAFILRVEEIAKELSTLVGDEGGGSEKSCILLVNEMPQGSTQQPNARPSSEVAKG